MDEGEIRIVSELGPGDFSKWFFEALWKAYLDARKGKRATLDEHLFELNEAENLMRLRDAVLWRAYETGVGIAFIATHPVPREIFAACFKDRIIHHFLYNVVADWWDKRLIYDSYSCREGKGVQFGVKRMQHHIEAVSENYQKKAYVIKMDIQSYFMSLPKDKLYERIVWGLDRQFAGYEDGRLYDLVKYLWHEIIFDDPRRKVVRKGSLLMWRLLPPSKSLFCQPPGRGIVIGNLSSQLLSNIYLDQLDRFVTQELGYKHYGRYVDDFFIVVSEEELPQAKRDIEVIRGYLEMIGLKLHPTKTKIQEVHEAGVPWLGAVVYRWGVTPGRRFKRFFYEAAEQFNTPKEEGRVVSVLSYMGHMKCYKSMKFERELFENMGWRYRC